jgi:prepilin-type N-terminal cleavage/methylation domain-containing protein
MNGDCVKNTPNFQTHARAAFTLIELAIVLVIIALLIGGIAAFGTFSKNAKLNTMMNESKILISAFNQFQSRYGAPPGDMSNASGSWKEAAAATSSDLTNHNGNGNGVIRAKTGCIGTPATCDDLERYYAFQHLALAGFIQGTYTGAVNSAGGATVGLNVVGSSVDKSAFIFDHPDAADGLVSGDALYFDGFYGNILRVAGLNDNSATIPALGFITPKDALGLDLKFDDGQPGLGNVMTPKSTALANCASSAATTATYVTTDENKTCYLILRMQ